MSKFNKPTKEAVMQKLENLEADVSQLKIKTQQEFYDELRNGVIEEVAKEIEKMKVFGNDTLSSFAIYIRGMKK